MQRSSLLNNIWLSAAAALGAWFSDSDTTSMILGGVLGFLSTAYFIYVALPAMGDKVRYLLYILPLFVVMIAAFLLSPDVLPKWTCDAIINGFRGFGIGLFITAMASKIIPK